MAIVLAIFYGTPITVPMVEAAGGSVSTVHETPVAGATGWIGCDESRCAIQLVDASHLRHEACHLADALSDGRMDGAISGWQPQTGAGLDHLGPVEALGYFCGAQEVN